MVLNSAPLFFRVAWVAPVSLITASLSLDRTPLPLLLPLVPLLLCSLLHRFGRTRIDCPALLCAAILIAAGVFLTWMLAMIIDINCDDGAASTGCAEARYTRTLAVGLGYAAVAVAVLIEGARYVKDSDRIEIPEVVAGVQPGMASPRSLACWSHNKCEKSIFKVFFFFFLAPKK